MSSEMENMSKYTQYLSLMIARVPGLNLLEKTTRISGEDHAPVFACELTCGDHKGYSCASRSKKVAKHDAAKSLVNNVAFARWIEAQAVRPLATSALRLGIAPVVKGEDLRKRLDDEHVLLYGKPPSISVCKSGQRHRAVLVYGQHYIPGCGGSMADAITSTYVTLDRVLATVAANQEEDRVLLKEVDAVIVKEDGKSENGNFSRRKQCKDAVDGRSKVEPAVKPVERWRARVECSSYRDPTVSVVKKTSAPIRLGEVKYDGSYQTTVVYGNTGGELVEYDRALMSKYKAMELDCDVLCDTIIDRMGSEACTDLRREVDVVFIDPDELNYRKTGLSRLVLGWKAVPLGQCLIPHCLSQGIKSVVVITDDPSVANVEELGRAYGIKLCVLDTEFKVRMWLSARRARVKEKRDRMC